MGFAAFLDRDGVINAEVNYLHEPDKVVILPGVAEALRMIRERGYRVIVVTNQAGVAKGYYGESDIDAVHRRIDEILAAEGAKVDEYFYCPHHPQFTGECDCRKPSPGMLLEAAEKFGIDCAGSFMVGDRLSDVEAGVRAGCSRSFLVRSGYGETVIAEQDVSGIEIADDLLDAVRMFFAGQE